MTYSRQSPSPRYVQLLDFYKQMHDEGVEESAAKDTFSGVSLGPHVDAIGSLLQQFNSKSLLDYGAGKARFYDAKLFRGRDGQPATLQTYWGLERMYLYDPGYEPFSRLPDGAFDVVICTDVMEHIPEEDLPWVIDELFGYTRQFMYVCVATYPARKTFPNGENVHVTLRDRKWWIDLFDSRRKALGSSAHYFIIFFESATAPEPVVVTSL